MTPEINFTEEQLVAINTDHPKLVIRACPGSGKTTTLVGRIHQTIDMRGANMEEIAVMTFTNATANHILSKLNDEGITPGFCGTLHAFMLRWVVAWHQIEGLARPGIMPPHEVDPLLSQINDELRAKLPMKKIKEEYARVASGDQPAAGHAGMVVSRYRQIILQSGLYDYDALLLLGREYMRRMKADESLTLGFASDEVERLLAIKHLFVDETQDSSALDFTIYEDLKPKTATFVGDDDQAIYGWRGGDVAAFMELAYSPGVELLAMTRNFRSGKRICAAADRLITHNANRIKRAPMVGGGKDVGVDIFEAADSNGEKARVVAICSDIKKLGAKNMAVLCRTNAQATAYRQALAAAGIPVAQREFDGQQVAGLGEAITWLALCSNPRSNLLAEIYLKANAHRIAHPVSTLVLQSKVTGVCLNDALHIVPDCAPFTPVRDLVATHTPMHPESAVLSELVARCGAMLDLTPGDLLAGLKNMPLKELEAATDTPGITVTTIHGAKGREWGTVILPGWNDELFPLRNADEAEERRLAFVAITRAKSYVVITWAKELVSPFPPFRKSAGTISRFALELSKS